MPFERAEIGQMFQEYDRREIVHIPSEGMAQWSTALMATGSPVSASTSIPWWTHETLTPAEAIRRMKVRGWDHRFEIIGEQRV
ncbi:MAG: hypothetical protein KGL39_51040 [Patescibacteria group bacterium]|nr:hypothetical protein [Patescibacteria group bacterium]